MLVLMEYSTTYLIIQISRASEFNKMAIKWLQDSINTVKKG